MMSGWILGVLALTVGATAQGEGRAVRDAIAVGGELQLFVDDAVLESMEGVELKLHSPVQGEIVLRADKPWEDPLMFDPCVVLDDGRYRMWYRANFDSAPFYTGYAESADGIVWEKPSLGLIPFDESTDNNLVWSSGADKTQGAVLSVFKDGNPKARDDERYKAIATGPGCETMLGLVSPDGLHWRRMQEEPIIVGPEEDKLFDAHNIAFWDEARGQYVAYLRGWPEGWPDGIRGMRRATSTDFRTWSKMEYLDLGDSSPEHLYKNAATPYYRRPDLLLMFPKRFMPERKPDPDWPHAGVSDIVFMFSRDGLHWDRRFMEAFIRPGQDPLNWHERAIEVGPGLVPTPDGRMSLYYIEHYRTDSVRIRRGVLRVDGLVSVHAGYEGGELVTKPLVFEGTRLVLNYATSAAGSVRVEIQDAGGTPVSGFGLGDCTEIYGDHLERVVIWGDNADVGALAGKDVRLRIVMKDGDLYSLRFVE